MTRFTHRYVNQIVGAFVLLTLLISSVGIYMAGRAQHWFERTVAIDLLLPREGCFGLKPGAIVTVMGTEAGEVTAIHIRDDDRMIASMAVRQDFTRFIRTNSRASIKKTMGLAGDAFVEISGHQGQSLPVDALIETTVDLAIGEMLQETLNEIRTEVLPAARSIRLAADRYAQLAVSFGDPEHPVLKTLETIHSIATKIDEGDGLAHRLLTDKQMADDVGSMIDRANVTLEETGAAVQALRGVVAQIGQSVKTLHATIEQSPETVRQVNAAVADIREISGNLIRVTDSMPATIENVNAQVASLSGILIQAQATLREFQRLAEAAQRHWLIRGYVEDDRANTRIASKEVIITP